MSADTRPLKRIDYRKREREKKIGSFFVYLLFIVLSFIALYPLFWVLINSFKKDGELFSKSWALPKVFRPENYEVAWKYGISRYVLNSMIVTVITVIIVLGISLLAAYALSRFRFKGDTFFLLFIMGGLMLAPEVSLIPLFKILSLMGLYNTYWAMILPNVAYGVPFTTFLIRSYMLGVSKDFEEASAIDGATLLQNLVHVIIPLCRPIIASAALIEAMRVWNEFMFGLTFVTSDKFKTIPVGLMAFGGALREQYTVIMAGIIMSALPMVILFLLAHKNFIRGLTVGGVKG